MMFLYNALYAGALGLLLPFEYFKRPVSLRKRWLADRCGYLTLSDCDGATDKAHPVVWLHAVSVGEVISATPLIKRILKDVTPNVVLSTVTDTGQAVARQRLKTCPPDVNRNDVSQDSVKLVYIPFDLPHMVRRAVSSIRPDIFISMETEIWPEIFHTMHTNNTPVVILNGRISSKSYKGYKKIRFFMKEVLSVVTFLGMQNEIYAERIIDIGADERRVKVIGNLKYDIEPPTVVPQWAERLPGPVIVVGSTHEGEEEIILPVYKRLKEQFPTLTLILAPRHPQRFDEVERSIKRAGLRCFRRSFFTQTLPQTEVILLDTIGELASVYGAGEVCMMGGSFVAKGGHNLLEPAAWARPIICGPYMDNFPMTGEFIEKGAAISVNAYGLYDSLKELLSDEALRQRIGSAAKDIYKKNSGALVRSVAEIEKILRDVVKY
ncbi:MAG: 3-deoxy-D-manno-octulosonic acid transferase [Nitrospirae bacterium]|nr:3-deoxy-D-manno-octulosonic acid transferase [Nitrospirota bacterium]